MHFLPSSPGFESRHSRNLSVGFSSVALQDIPLRIVDGTIEPQKSFQCVEKSFRKNRKIVEDEKSLMAEEQTNFNRSTLGENKKF